MRIGFFDSGIGGISITRSVKRDLPQYLYTYYADDRNMPYGNKKPETLFHLTTQALKILFEQERCLLVILACNTASTVLPRIQKVWLPETFPDRKVLGVIRPTVEYLTEKHSTHPVYVLATQRTVLSRAYDHELSKIGKTCDFHEIACPKLAQAIEISPHPSQDPSVYALCKEYLKNVPETIPVTIYTGCTHYAFAAPFIRKLRPLATVINQGHIISRKLDAYLSNHPAMAKKLKRSAGGATHLFCSSNSVEYVKKIEKLLNK